MTAARPDLGVIAVTGATGFIGSHLITALAERGWRPRLLVRRLSPMGPLPDGTQFVPGDLADERALRRLVDGVACVIHLAGAIKARDTAHFMRVNARGTAQLVAACRAQPGIRRLVALSSLAAREPSLSPYAASKQAAEVELARLADVVPWVAVRAPVVYGPGDRETLAIFKLARFGVAPLLDGGRGRVSLIHVADLVRAIADSLERPAPISGAFEIDDGTPDGYSHREIIDLAGQCLGRRPRVLSLPYSVMQIAAAMTQLATRVTGGNAILSSGKVREMRHPDWVAHDRRLAAWLDFQPAFTAGTGFADTIAWYRNRRWL